MINELQKVATESLTPKEFIEREQALSNITLRQMVVQFLNRAYGGLLISTVTLIFLQGFHLWGFELDSGFLNWLGAATVGEIVGLCVLVYGALFRSD